MVVEEKGLFKTKFIVFLILIALIIFVVKTFDLSSLLSSEMVREKVSSYGPLAPIAFILFYIIATVFFLPGTPITIAAGLLFGNFEGFVYVLIGATIGAVIAFLVARTLGEPFVAKVLKKGHKKIYKYDKKIKENGFLVVFFLRLVPLFPFNGLNFALGLTKIGVWQYTLATLIGIIPGSFVLVYLGDSLGDFDISQMIIAIVLFILLSVAPIIYQKWRKKKNG